MARSVLHKTPVLGIDESEATVSLRPPGCPMARVSWRDTSAARLSRTQENYRLISRRHEG
jgi:hypothetical protein